VPLFDFRCRACAHTFEALVLHGRQPACPSCHGRDLERLPSTFAPSSAERTRAAATAQRRRAAATASQENIVTERETEEHRREEH
jgi:putative FmdB family regulatory protein